jgi:hypothetical protein
MQMHQVNIGYDPGQDRLLLRISTTEDSEYRLWLTRRMVQGLWRGLMQLVSSGDLIKRQAAPEAKQAVMEFQREQAMQKTNYGGEYQEPKQVANPGGEPILVFGVRMRPVGDGTHDLHLLPKEGAGVNLRLTETMLHALVKLVQDGVKATDWDLKLDQPLAVPEAAAATGTERKLN